MENEKIKITPPVADGVKNKKIETYAEDMAKVIEGNEGRLIKTIIHEQELKEAEKKNLSPKSSKNKAFMFIGFLLLFLAIVLVYFLGFFNKKINTVPIIQEFSPIIFIDKNYFQDISGLDKDAISQSVLNDVRNSDIENGEIEAIFLTVDKQVIGLREFIKNIKSNFVVPSPSFMEDRFLIGTYNKSNKDLFILLKVRTTSDVFESMHGWESKMFYDLHGFFGINLSASTKELLSKDFVDQRVSNKNARILYDKDGKIVMMYVFVDDHSVVITNSEEATTEVILRLASSQISK